MTDGRKQQSEDGLFEEFDEALKELAEPGTAVKKLGDEFATTKTGFQPIEKPEEFDVDEQIRDYLGFMHRATEAHKLQSAAKLITAKVTDQLPNGDLPEIKKLVVPPDSTMFLFSERHAPRELEPGKDYEVSRLGLGGGVSRSLEAFSKNAATGSYQERSGVLICEIPRKSLPLTITLPDYYGFYPPGIFGDQFKTLVASMDQEKDPTLREARVEELAKTLGRVFEESRLKTQEGICTGVRVQLDIGVVDPHKLVESYCRSYVRQLQKVYGENDKKLHRQPVTPGLARNLKFPLKLLTQLCFGARQENGVPLKPVTLRHVYKRIRLEVADALRDAIREESAKQLIEEPARVRERVEPVIREHLGKSLGLYGAEIRRVVSVECVAPEYNRMIIERGRLNMRNELIQDDDKRADLEELELQTETRRFQNQVRHQNERSQHSTAQEGATKRQQLDQIGQTMEVQDKLEADALARRLKREAEEAEHQRQQRLLNASTDVDIQQQQELAALEFEKERAKIQQEKMQAALELSERYETHQHGLQQDALDREHQRQVEQLTLTFNQQMESNAAEMNNRIGFLKQFAGLSEGIEENKLLVMALASNPKLAKPYVEATRANGREQLIEKMEDFRSQLVDVHGKEDKLVHQLWTEGVKQIGSVLAKQSQKPDTNVYARNVNVEENIDLPNGN